MTILVPDKFGDYGKRIPVQRGINSWDAFDWLIVREYANDQWYIPLNGFIASAIPILLQMARPDGDVPVIYDLRDEPQRFVEIVHRWINGHQNVRERLGKACGVRRWRKASDIDRALTMAPSEYSCALHLMKNDPWLWREVWS